MPYTIKKFNGQTLTVIEDGTVDTASTNLNLPGKNYAGYGKALNESLVYLLENFANSVEPSRKLTGQLWYDSTSKKIKIYDGTKFRSLGSIEYGSSAPENQVTGDQWFNTTTNQLFVWNGTAHKLIGPLQVGTNTSQLVSKRLLDDGGNTQTVLQAVVGTTTVGATVGATTAVIAVIGKDKPVILYRSSKKIIYPMKFYAHFPTQFS